MTTTLQIEYHNKQGALMRILNAVSRRGLDFPYVHAEPFQSWHRVILTVEVTPKQVAQLSRDWHAIVDVIEVRAGVHEALSLSGEWAASQVAGSRGRVMGALA